MVESTFRTGEDLLITTFRNSVTVGDLAKALAAYDHESFSTSTNVVYDMLGAEIGFDSSAATTLENMFGRRRRRGDGTRTAIVTDNPAIRSLLEDAYTNREWPTQWGFFKEMEDAIAWARSGAIDARG